MKPRPSLRLALPPLGTLTPESQVHGVVRVEKNGAWQHVHKSLRALGQAWPGAHVALALHPRDAVLARIPVPPLSAARLRAAVRSEVEALVLDDIAGMSLAHSGRGEDGAVSVAWVAQDALQRVVEMLLSCELLPTTAHPAALLLELDGDALSVYTTPDAILLRRSLEIGAVHWHASAVSIQADSDNTRVRWIGTVPDTVVDGTVPLPLSAAWTGPLPRWSLPLPKAPRLARNDSWSAALRWCAIALVVWALGPFVQLWQLQAQQHMTQQQMANQLRAAFPSQTEVLDPLQQARRQVARARNGDTEYAQLLGRAATLPVLAGQVQRLRYADHVLLLDAVPGAGGAIDAPMARQAGVQVQWSDHTWKISRLSGKGVAFAGQQAKTTLASAESER